MKSTHLYVIRCGDYVKIGVTNDVDKRLKQLQTGNPSQLVLEYVEARYKPEKAEKWLHQVFQHKRINGEWFKELSGEDIRKKLFLFHGQPCEPIYNGP